MTERSRSSRSGGSRDTQIGRLHEATSVLHTCSTHEEAYDVVIDAAVEVVGLDWCGLAKAVDGWFELVAISENAPLTVGERYLRTDEGSAGRAYRTGEPDVIDDVRQSEQGKPVDELFRSGLTVPVDDWGVFQGVSSEANRFDETDVELAGLLVMHAVEAFDRLDAEARLRRQNERLEAFASVVSHDLKSPLTVAVGRLELYRETGDVHHADELENALARMDVLIDDLLQLARQGDDVGELDSVDLRTLAREAWSNVETGTAQLAVRTEQTINADPGRLLQLFENLLCNAIEHGSIPSRSDADDEIAADSMTTDAEADSMTTDSGATPERVCVTVGSSDRGFYVEDNGPGIPELERDAVFKTTYSTSETGTGLGLAIVETIVSAHGWRIELDTGETGGARFEIITE